MKRLVFASIMFLFLIGVASAVTYTSEYPPAQSATYVKATSQAGTSYVPYFATDPAKSLTGTWVGNIWISTYDPQSPTNQRFHIDLGSGHIIRRIYYENAHSVGSDTNVGAKNFTFWGSNSADSFASLTYSNDTGWTQLSINSSTFVQHVTSNVADPHYVTVSNVETYRYYAFKIANNYGAVDYMGLRRVVLQTDDTDLTPPASITGLTYDNTTTCEQITWNWTKPADADLGGIMIYNNGYFIHNGSAAATNSVWGSLTGGVSYEFASHTFDNATPPNVNMTWVNGTAIASSCDVAPVSDFSADDTTVCISQTIQFNDTSTNTPTTWFWLFGDSQDSHSQNPTHAYDTAGTYTVSLNASNIAGYDINEKVDYITVNDCGVPTVEFTYNSTCGVGSLPVGFTDVSTDATDWYWDFGDGNTSVLQSPSYLYEGYGIFTVSHNATNAYGTVWENKTNLITVALEGTYCDASSGGNVTVVGGNNPPTTTPLKPNLVVLPFLVIPLISMFYIFRGDGTENNSVWGDVIATGTGMVVSAMVALWFIQGGVTSIPVTVENATYVIPSTMSIDDAYTVQSNAAQEVSVLGAKGSGMFITSGISSMEPSEGATITVHTHDTVTQQYTDVGVAMLYMMFTLILAVLFLYSIAFGIQQVRDDDYES
jgi:PKD repeat protein